jgi:hypothetical protein
MQWDTNVNAGNPDAPNVPYGDTIFTAASNAATQSGALLDSAIAGARNTLEQAQPADAVDVMTSAYARTLPATRASMLSAARVPLWVACLEKENLQQWLMGNEVTRTAREKMRCKILKGYARKGKKVRKYSTSKQRASMMYGRPFRSFSPYRGYKKKFRSRRRYMGRRRSYGRRRY